MKIPKPVTIDFETESIEGRPAYPPKPVGVAVKYWGKKAKYYAWGHLEENNCDYETAYKALNDAYVYGCKHGILYHNAKFDVDVADTHMGLVLPEWNKIHDTMFLLYLNNPHQDKLELKDAAEKLLGEPPEEQDKLKDWIFENVPKLYGLKVSKSKDSKDYWAGYIALAPGDLVGKYAIGDVNRTEKLFKFLWPDIQERKMLGAYKREQKLMPILLEMERQGLPVHLKQLEKDVTDYSEWLYKIDSWVIKRLKAPTNLNIDSGKELMNAMIAANKVDLDLATHTPSSTPEKPRYATNKDALLVAVKDKQLLAVLKYRAQLSTCLSTFMVPWLEVAKKSKGLIFTSWNQVRQPAGKGTKGTRTGRLSSNPNFQNIPKAFKPIFAHEEKGLPKCPLKGLPPLPKVRGYVIPFKNEILIDRDYSQQEVRILAHFDGGDIMNNYVNDPWLDMHDYAKAELEKMGKYYERGMVKTVNFGLIYGKGVGLLAEETNSTVKESKELKANILTLMPGLKEMYSDMRVRSRTNTPIRTWGGREYYCEPARIVKGTLRTFDYKLVNVLVQGSAADCIKEALIRYHAVKHPKAKILLNVHDQITVSIPKRFFKKEMEVLKNCMESVEFDVPMLSEGKVSTNSWASLITYDKKGEIIYS